MWLLRALFLLGSVLFVFCDLCSPISGHDCVGNDLHNISNVASAASCCTLCTNSCTVWKWDSGDRCVIYIVSKYNQYSSLVMTPSYCSTCYLKDGCDDVYPCPTCITGSDITATPSSSQSQTFSVSASPSPSPLPVAFACSARSSLLTVYADSTYDLSTGEADGGAAWFTSGDVALRSGNSWYSISSKGLRPLRSSMSNGTDAFGPFSAFTVLFDTVGGGAPGLALSATFACYSSGLIAFNASVPGGANGTETGSGSTPVIQFPSFAAGPETVLGASLGWLVNGGIWTLFEVWGVGVSNSFSSTDGPVWIYNTTFAPSTTAPPGAPSAPVAAVLAPLAHFKASQASVIHDPTSSGALRLVIGPLGTAQSIPVGYTSSAGIWASSEGINAATFEWGAALRTAYGTRRIPVSRDVLNDKLSYWSDNGATYFQSWWDTHCNRHCNASYNAATQFEALKEYHESVGLPFALYQLDTW